MVEVCIILWPELGMCGVSVLSGVNTVRIDGC